MSVPVHESKGLRVWRAASLGAAQQIHRAAGLFTDYLLLGGGAARPQW